jgi:hypothetical protein
LFTFFLFFSLFNVSVQKEVCPIRGVFWPTKSFSFFCRATHADSEYIYFIEVWIKIGLFMLKNKFFGKKGNFGKNNTFLVIFKELKWQNTLVLGM